MNFSESILRHHDEDGFGRLALELFRRTLEHNPVYAEYVSVLQIDPETIRVPGDIPCLPVGFFKTREVYASETAPGKIFLSSGTTGQERSRHSIADIDLYRRSLLEGFRYFYGDPGDYFIAALTPSPKENPDSSLAFMIAELISNTDGLFLGTTPPSYLPLLPLLPSRIKKKRLFLIGLAYVLLDLAGERVTVGPDPIVVETGGMKGRQKEMIREELHQRIAEGFGVKSVHSEYSMSELLSQAWSKGEGVFRCPPWMKVLIHDPNDPMTLLNPGQTGGINIIDLANVHSCPFIATQDLGRLRNDGSFEVLGRFDYSELRGCSLMV